MPLKRCRLEQGPPLALQLSQAALELEVKDLGVVHHHFQLQAVLAAV